MAKASFAQKRLNNKARRAKIARYKAETKALKLKAKSDYKLGVQRAKALIPLEKQRLNNSLAKHATWASTASNIFGKSTNVANKAIESKTASSSQNVNGGLESTQKGRDDDEEKDTVDGGGVVY